MAELGLLSDVSEGEFWLGSVFRDTRFVPTGDKYIYSDEARNIHEREVKWWKLAGATPTIALSDLPGGSTSPPERPTYSPTCPKCGMLADDGVCMWCGTSQV
jgi:hypothetical protein